MENTNKVNNAQINGMKNRYTLGLLATLCLLTSSFGIKAMENREIGVNIVNSEESQRLAEKLKTILENQNGSPAENLKEFKETLAALEKIAGPSIGKIIDDNKFLHLATQHEKTEAIKVLVELGAKIEARSEDGLTALHYAAACGKTEAIRALIEKGADIEVETASGRTPLHLAAKYGQTESIKLLVGLGADIEAKDEDGCTPLHLAAWNNQTKAIKLLFEKGADIEAKIADGINKSKTAFDFATELRNQEALLWINLAKEYNQAKNKLEFIKTKPKQCEILFLVKRIPTDAIRSNDTQLMKKLFEQIEFDCEFINNNDNANEIKLAIKLFATDKVGKSMESAILTHDVNCKYMSLIFEKSICGNRGNNTEKINYKIKAALKRIEQNENKSILRWIVRFVTCQANRSAIEADEQKSLYRNLKNSFVIINDLAGIKIKDNKKVKIHDLPLDTLGRIMSFADIDFGKKVDAKGLAAINKFEHDKFEYDKNK